MNWHAVQECSKMWKISAFGDTCLTHTEPLQCPEPQHRLFKLFLQFPNRKLPNPRRRNSIRTYVPCSVASLDDDALRNDIGERDAITHTGRGTHKQAHRYVSGSTLALGIICT